MTLYNLLINKYLYYIHNTVAVIDNNLSINNLVRMLRCFQRSFVSLIYFNKISIVGNKNIRLEKLKLNEKRLVYSWFSQNYLAHIKCLSYIFL